MRSSYPRSTSRQPQPSEIPRRLPRRRPKYPPNNFYRQFAPPSGPSFIVELLSDHRTFRKREIDAVIANCKSRPERLEVSPANRIVASLFYTQWVDALEALVYFWESRLDRVHDLTPKLNRIVSVPSDLDELRDRLKALFAGQIKKLMDGEAVKKWEAKRVWLCNDNERVSKLLRRHNHLWNFSELNETLKRNKSEIQLVESRIGEFKSAMNCLLDYLEGKGAQESGGEGVKVFKFSTEVYDWSRIHSLIVRECRRLEEGLPIYAYRQQILQQILTQQVQCG